VAQMGEGPSATNTTSLPAARDEKLLVETVGDETVVYDLDSKEAHCLKPLAALVFRNADGKTSAAELASLAEDRLGEPVSEANVLEAMLQLEASDLLRAPVTQNGNGLSRRQMIGKSAATAGALAGASLVTSVLTSDAFAAGASQIPFGCTGCGGNPDCVSNHCCQSNAGKSCLQSCCVGKDNSCHQCTVNGQLICTVAPSAGESCPTCSCNDPSCTDPNCCPAGSDICCTANPPC
jgi:hypothetical protein